MMEVEYYVRQRLFASRTLNLIPRIGEQVRLKRIYYLVENVVWIEDEATPRVCLDIKQITQAESEDSPPELKAGDTAQVVGEHPFAGRVGKAKAVYWTKSRAGGKQPRWIAFMQFKRDGGTFPIQPKLFDVALLEKLD